MKILGLFFVVFGIIAIDKALGIDGEAMMVGVIIGAGAYIIGATHT